VTPNLVYHNYSTWFRSFNGAIVPVAHDILKLELPTMHRVGAKGAEMVGLGAWGYGGPNNYILAKQLWHADADVDALFIEWLHRAYGPGWEPMRELYDMVEKRMMQWKEQESPVYRGEQYEINYAVIDFVHRPIFPDMERLYLRALEKVQTEAQRKRLEMFGDNLIKLHHDMAEAGMIENPQGSYFYRTEEQYQQFMRDTEFSLSLYRDHGQRFTGGIWKGEWSG